MKRYIVWLAYIMCFLAVNAQNANRQSLIERINKIKSQTDTYLWDQFTHTDLDTAKVGSAKRLLMHVETEIGENAGVSLDDVLRCGGFIKIDRGNLKQFFAYISKEDAHRIKSGTPPKNENVNEAFQQIVGITKENNTTVEKNYVADAFTQRIYEVRTFSNVYKLLKSMQGNGQILQFGKLRDVEDYSSFDLILFDMKSEDIVTILSGETGNGTRTNLLDGKADSLENYPKELTAVIWYIKK